MTGCLRRERFLSATNCVSCKLYISAPKELPTTRDAAAGAVPVGTSLAAVGTPSSRTPRTGSAAAAAAAAAETRPDHRPSTALLRCSRTRDREGLTDVVLRPAPPPATLTQQRLNTH